MTDCARTREWLARQGTGSAPDPATDAACVAHVATCAACGDLQRRHAMFAAAATDELRHAASEAAEQELLRAIALGPAPPALAPLAEALRHPPSEAAELRFLAQVPAAVAPRRPRRAMPWVALAVAAALLVALGLQAVRPAGPPTFAPTPPPVAGTVDATPSVPGAVDAAPAVVSAVDAPVVVADRPAPADSAPTPAVARPLDVPDAAAPTAVAPGASAPGVAPTPGPRVAVTGPVVIDGRAVASGPFALAAGMALSTDHDAALTVVAPDDATLQLAADSRLLVERWDPAGSRLVLQSGSIDADVAHRAPGERFEIQTPNALVVVVGTRFRVTYTEGVGTLVEGTEGRVRVESPDGVVLGHVEAGQRLQVDEAPAGGTAARARALLAAGHDDEALALLRRTPDRDPALEALLGDALALAGEPASAAAAYQRAIAGHPRAPEALFLELVRVQDAALGDRDASVRTWTAYLEQHPSGRASGRAHLALAEHALAHDRPAVAEVHLRAALRDDGSADATEALARLTAQLLGDRRWDEAEGLLGPFAEATSEAGEIALVGLARVDIARGRPAAARKRLAAYDARFPQGVRRAEFERLGEAVERSRVGQPR